MAFVIMGGCRSYGELSKTFAKNDGSLAQLVEHRTFNPQVLGSSPRRPITLDSLIEEHNGKRT